MLHLARVGKRYGDRLVLKDISFSLREGNITLLAGANGSGKSTLLHIIAGLTAPDHGTVTHSLADGAIGYLGHQTLLYPGLTALENLAFWSSLHTHAVPEKNLLATLEHMGLGAFAHEKAGTFSRGMSQRLSLARLFLLQPQLILLDEPGTGLDSNSLALLRRELLQAKAQGCALLWVTHTVSDDLALADDVLLIANTLLAYSGSAQEFSSHPLYTGNTAGGAS